MHRFKPRAGLLQAALRAAFAGPNPSGAKPGAPTDPTVKFILDHGLFQRALGGDAPSYIPAEMFAKALIDGLIPDSEAGKGPPAIASLRESAAKLPDSSAKQAVLAILDRTGGDIEAATKEIEQWYGGLMDRVTGVYKRHVQLFLFLTGLTLATILNADTLLIAQTLSSDPQTRAAVVTEALKTATKPLPAASTGTPTTDDLKSRMTAAQDALRGSGLSLGWSSTCGDARAYPWKQQTGSATTVSSVILCWTSKFLGLVLTAIAISFGAPFWFDLLNRVTNLRASGPKPSDPDPKKSAASH